MKRFKFLKQMLLIFFSAQLAFSVFGPPRGVNNIYPIYSWRIFHPQPDKYLSVNNIYFHQIDDEVFSPPKKGLSFAREAFPKMRDYTFQKKVEEFNPEDKSTENIKEEINRIFIDDHDHQKVVWEVRKLTYDPIKFYWEKKIEEERSYGKIVAESSR